MRLPFFFSILTDSEGRIYVRTGAGEAGPGRAKSYDIFTRDGYYAYRTSLEISPIIIKHGCLYTLARDEETGDEIVRRFRIRNGDKLRRLSP